MDMSDRSVKNEFGEVFRVGDDHIARIDNYKRGGKLLAISEDRGVLKALVRWPGLDDEWMSPRDMHKPMDTSTGATDGPQ